MNSARGKEGERGYGCPNLRLDGSGDDDGDGNGDCVDEWQGRGAGGGGGGGSGEPSHVTHSCLHLWRSPHGDVDGVDEEEGW